MATDIRATVFTVERILPHPNADKLEIVMALGWQVVTAKGLHKIGEKCVYIQPDSIIPDEWAQKWGVKPYLKGPNQNRVGQIRLRGEPSFGFIVSLPEGMDFPDGTNLAPFFGITKYEPPIKVSAGDSEVDHPLFCKYTDIENLRNFPDAFKPGEEIVATEKIHGTNCRVGMIEGEEMAGSMSVRRKKPNSVDAYLFNTYWFPWTLQPVSEMIRQSSRNSKQFIVFGEIYGNAIQNGYVYDAGDRKLGFRVFDILVNGHFLSHDELASLCEKYGVSTVPVLYRGPFSLESIRCVANGKTTLGEKHIREGVVVRPVLERTDPRLGRLVLKYISDEYLLSKHPDSKDV